MKKFYAVFAVLTVLIICFTLFKAPSTKNDEKPLSDDLKATEKDTGFSGEMEVHFIDVGQGDCIFIRTENECMLIDAGPVKSGNKVCEYLEKIGVKNIDYFIGTHPHEDHLGGATAVIQRFETGNIYMTEQMSNSYFFEKLLDVIERKSLSVTVPKLHTVYKAHDFDFKFLAPEEITNNTNNNSLVTRVTFGDTAVLLTGDSEETVENDILCSEDDISADVIKIGHHGSRYASTNEFLDAVNPKLAVIQCGEGNSYGHPHSEVIDRLERRNIEILRCDDSGDIVLKSDGRKFVVCK